MIGHSKVLHMHEQGSLPQSGCIPHPASDPPRPSQLAAGPSLGRAAAHGRPGPNRDFTLACTERPQKAYSHVLKNIGWDRLDGKQLISKLEGHAAAYKGTYLTRNSAAEGVFSLTRGVFRCASQCLLGRVRDIARSHIRICHTTSNTRFPCKVHGHLVVRMLGNAHPAELQP